MSAYYPNKSVLFTTVEEIQEVLGFKFTDERDYVIVSIPVPFESRNMYIHDTDPQRKSCCYLTTDDGEVMMELTEGLVFVPNPADGIGYRFDGRNWSDCPASSIDQDNVYVGTKFLRKLVPGINVVTGGKEQVITMIKDGLAERQRLLLLDAVPETALPN